MPTLCMCMLGKVYDKCRCERCQHTLLGHSGGPYLFRLMTSILFEDCLRIPIINSKYQLLDHSSRESSQCFFFGTLHSLYSCSHLTETLYALLMAPSSDIRSSSEYDESEFILRKHAEKARPRRWTYKLPSPWVFSTFLFAALSLV